jgi:hypothetical protein
MHPNEKGRHCLTCQKTVVDFTLMSDGEIINYFSKPAGSVCGRLSADQLNRKLEVPHPPRKSPWAGWPLLLSGLLFTSDETGSHRTKGFVVAVQCERPKSNSPKHIMEGTPAVMEMDTNAMEQFDTVKHFKMGELTGDMATVVEPPGDTVMHANDSVQPGKRDEMPLDNVFSGGIEVVVLSDHAEDSVAIRRTLATMTGSIIDTVKKTVSDSLSVIGVKLQKDSSKIYDDLSSALMDVTIYPNPVLKGAGLNLSWKKETADIRVDLYTINGVLVQSWMLQGGSITQTLMVPANIAAGVYVLQVQTKGSGYSKKLIIE